MIIDIKEWHSYNNLFINIYLYWEDLTDDDHDKIESILNKLFIGLKQYGIQKLSYEELGFLSDIFFNKIKDWINAIEDPECIRTNTKLDTISEKDYTNLFNIYHIASELHEKISKSIGIERQKNKSYNNITKVRCIQNFKKLINTYQEAKRYLQNLGYTESDLLIRYN